MRTIHLVWCYPHPKKKKGNFCGEFDFYLFREIWVPLARVFSCTRPEWISPKRQAKPKNQSLFRSIISSTTFTFLLSSFVCIQHLDLSPHPIPPTHPPPQQQQRWLGLQKTNWALTARLTSESKKGPAYFIGWYWHQKVECMMHTLPPKTIS